MLKYPEMGQAIEKAVNVLPHYIQSKKINKKKCAIIASRFSNNVKNFIEVKTFLERGKTSSVDCVIHGRGER